MTIDLDTLREMLAEAEYDAKYYADAGPDRTKRRRYANCLRRVIAYHEGRVYVPGEVGA